MPTVKDQAICIRHWDWSETSQTVSLFSREHGVIRGLAKGARRENAPFSGGIELLTRGEVVFISKLSARNQGALSTITAWDLEDPRALLRRSLPHLHAAMFLADLVHHAIRDLDPHPALFAALDSALVALADGQTHVRITAWFLWNLLTDTGYRPELFTDPRTGKQIADVRVFMFSPRHGGLVQEGGASSDVAPAVITMGGGAVSAALGKDDVWKVRQDTVEVLRRLAGGEKTLDMTRFVADTSLPDEAVVRSMALMASYFRFIHGAWPPSIRWVLPDLVQR